MQELTLFEWIERENDRLDESEANMGAQEAARPPEPAQPPEPEKPAEQAPVPELLPEDEPAREPADAGQVDDTGPVADEDAGPVEGDQEAPSSSSGFKTVDFQNEGPTPSVLRAVQALHDPRDGTKRPPICYCGAPRLAEVDVHLREDGTGRKKAGVSGVWRCRNGEVCPMCMEAATARRRDSYARVGGAAIEKGGTLVTVVLSVAHSIEDKLADLIKAVKKASTGARAGGPWDRKIKPALGCAGVLLDHHVRHGDCYGWHYHQHVTFFCLNRDETAIKAAIAALVERYVRLLARQGYRAHASQQHVKILKENPEGGPYTYPADHNRVDDEDEMAIVAAEHGEDESLTPLMLAERAAMGDERSAALFMEFSQAIRKTRSVVVTPALATALEIERKEDDAPAYTEQTRLGSIPRMVWTKLIDQNLNGTFLTRVESAGRENWPAVRWWALEQTDEAPDYSVELADEIAELISAQQRMSDPIARELAQAQIEILNGDWSVSHSAELVTGTLEYVEANHRHMQVDPAGVDFWVNALEDNADKIARRRRDAASRTTLPVGDDRPRQAVPVG